MFGIFFYGLSFVGGLRQTFDNTLTNLRQNLVDANANLAKYTLGAEGVFWIGLGSHQLSVVQVLSNLCHRFVEVLLETSDKDEH